MAELLQASMPLSVDLGQGYTLQIAAIDQVTGNTIAAVTVSNMTLEVAAVAGGSPADLQSGPFMLVPGPGA